MPPKPRSCNGSREKAQRRRPGRRAGSPLRLETLGLPRRGRPYPAGAPPPWPETGWTRTDLYRTWRYHASPPMRAGPVLSPTQPINGTGQTKDRMLLTRHPLGRGPPHPTGQRSTCRLSYRSGPRPTADIRIGRLQLTRTMDPGSLPGHQLTGVKTGPTTSLPKSQIV
jgi:hypothetical protein